MDKTRLKLYKIILLSVSCLFSSIHAVGAFAGEGQSAVELPALHLIPQPREIRVDTTVFRIGKGPIHICFDDPVHEFAVEQLANEITEKFGMDVVVNDVNATPQLLLGIPETDIFIRNALAGTGLVCDPELGPEGYVLAISSERIVIGGNTGKGVFYGVQTLRQIIRSCDANHRIPCLRIRDYPMLRIRGVLDDISRGPLPTMDYFKSCINRYAELKINALTFYTEHVVRTESHPAFAPTDALTLGEIRELVDYAGKHHIELIGCFQSLGHFEKILEHPRYEPLGEMHSLLSPAEPGSYKLLSDMYRELTAVYPSREFCVLCDEVWALGKGASQTMVHEQGLEKVYADHVNWTGNELGKYGKRIWVAADVALEHRDILSRLNKDIVMLPWDYADRPSFEYMIAPIREQDFEFVVTTGVSCSRKIYPDFRNTRGNIRNFVRDGVKHGALGMLNTNWDDFGGNFLSNNWYGIAYGADQGWHSENTETSNFDDRFATSLYGDRTGIISKAMLELSSVVEYAPVQRLENTVFWKELIPDRGVRALISLAQWGAVEKRARSALDLLGRCKVGRFRGDLEYFRYACEQVIFMADFRKSLIAAAEHYRKACLSQPDEMRTAEHLGQAISIISGLKDRWEKLEVTYQELWHQENRPYALDVSIRKFVVIHNDLDDVIALLDKAERDLESGYFLPSPLQVRLDIRELKQQFFQTWLLCGSFPNPKKVPGLPSHAPGNCVGFDTDYLLDAGGQAKVNPDAGDLVRRPDGSEVRWTEYTTTLGAKVDLIGRFDADARVVAYAFCTIESEKDTVVTAALGSNDGIKVFLNGDKVHEHHEIRFVKIDDDRVDLPLKKGVNRLLLKIDQGRGKWGFCFRIPDSRIMNNGSHYRLK